VCVPVNSVTTEIAMNLFLALPTGLSQTILIDWLELKDLARVDEAIRSPTPRRQYLELFAAPMVLHTVPWSQAFHVDKQIAFLAWIVKRGIRVSSVSIPFQLDDNPGLKEQFFAKIAPTLQEIVFRGRLFGPSCAQFLRMAILLSNLKSIHFGCLDLHDVVLPVVSVANNNLTKIVLEGGYSEIFGVVIITDAVVTCIENNCAKLEYLELKGANKVTDASLDALASCGTGALKSLHVAEYCAVTNGAVARLLSRYPSMEVHLSQFSRRALF